MTKTVKCATAVVALAAVRHRRRMQAPAHSRSPAFRREVDAAIEKHAGSDGWRPESLDALRSHQPTPRSLAAAEGGIGADFIEMHLIHSSRARAADSAGDAATCNQELANARASCCADAFSRSCNQTAGRAFWKYWCFGSSLLFDESNQPEHRRCGKRSLRTAEIRKQFTIARDRLRGSLRVVDDRSRLGGRANRGNRSGSFVRHSAAARHAHDIAAHLRDPRSRRAFRSVRPKLQRPASVQPAPSPGAGMESCSGTDGYPIIRRSCSTAAEFRETHRSPVPTADRIHLPLPSSSSFGRVGIPLGATELGGAGISPAAPVASPTPLGSGGQASGTSTITNPGNP